MLSGCSAPQPKPIIEYRTVTTVEDRFVPVPASLTAPVEVVTAPEKVDIIALGAAMEMCGVRLNVANGRLHDISLIGRQ